MTNQKPHKIDQNKQGHRKLLCDTPVTHVKTIKLTKKQLKTWDETTPQKIREFIDCGCRLPPTMPKSCGNCSCRTILNCNTDRHSQECYYNILMHYWHD